MEHKTGLKNQTKNHKNRDSFRKLAVWKPCSAPAIITKSNCRPWPLCGILRWPSVVSPVQISPSHPGSSWCSAAWPQRGGRLRLAVQGGGSAARGAPGCQWSESWSLRPLMRHGMNAGYRHGISSLWFLHYPFITRKNTEDWREALHNQEFHTDLIYPGVFLFAVALWLWQPLGLLL